MSKIDISLNDNFANPPIVKVNGKRIALLHDVHFDWNTGISTEKCAARFSASYWSKNKNGYVILRTKESYTPEMLGKDFK